MKILISLIGAHYLADFGLQNDFIAKFKVPGSAPFWIHVLSAHSAIQGLFVLLVTQSPHLAIAEFIAHFTIDYFKGKGKLSFNQDQFLHIGCKLVWAYLVFK
jgi:hypothetical protein